MPPDDRIVSGPVSDYVENSPFVRLLGTPSRVKILDVLLRRHSSWLSADEISSLAGIDQGTFSRNKDVLMELQLVDRDEDGPRITYKINTDHPVIENFGKGHTELLEYAPQVIEETSPLSQTHIREVISLIESQSNRGDDDDRDEDIPFAAVQEATRMTGDV